MYYYLTLTRRTLVMTFENTDVYFNSKEAMQDYRDRFKEYLYREGEYFISESGTASFNSRGILVKKK